MTRVFSLCLILTLAGCFPLKTWYRTGVPVAKLQQDQLDCEVSSLRDAPVRTQIRQDPPFFIPGRTICDPEGNCYTTPGYWREGRIYTVDANRGLRERLMAQCMGGKGYQPVSIPACPQAVANAAPPVAMRTLPPLSENSCSIRNSDGTFRIVERG